MRPPDRKSTRLNSSHTVIYTLSLHDALPISPRFSITTAWPSSRPSGIASGRAVMSANPPGGNATTRSEEHTSELQSHSDLHSFPTRRSSDLAAVLDHDGLAELATERDRERARRDVGESARRECDH